MLKVEILTKKKVDTFRIFASLPDMGRVGGLVSSFLASNLETEHIANIISNPKPWVNVKDGVIESTRDIYKIYFSDREKLLILTGECNLKTIENFSNYVTHFLIFVRRLVM
jgi:Uncharacterized protein (ATP-grasp superfamily)